MNAPPRSEGHSPWAIICLYAWTRLAAQGRESLLSEIPNLTLGRRRNPALRVLTDASRIAADAYGIEQAAMNFLEEFMNLSTYRSSFLTGADALAAILAGSSCNTRRLVVLGWAAPPAVPFTVRDSAGTDQLIAATAFAGAALLITELAPGQFFTANPGAATLDVTVLS